MEVCNSCMTFRLIISKLLNNYVRVNLKSVTNKRINTNCARIQKLNESCCKGLWLIIKRLKKICDKQIQGGENAPTALNTFDLKAHISTI